VQLSEWWRRLGENAVDARGYAAVRFALGAYLAVHFAALVPFGAELFSNAGVVPEASSSPLLALFPNLLALADGPALVAALLGSSVLAALALAFGRADRAAAVWLWYALACLAGRNPLIANPSLPYVGWLLLAHALTGPSPAQRSAGWRMPAPVYACAWLVLMAGYTYSGLTKLPSPSWLDGSALVAVLENPLARPTALRDALLALPPGLLRLATWAALALELLSLPLALVPRLRPWLWAALVALHLSLLALVDFADLTLGMLLVHAFVFDPAWLRAPLAFRVRRLAWR
jgi:hypothetical protein